MPDMTCVKSGSLDGGAADHKVRLLTLVDRLEC